MLYESTSLEGMTIEARDGDIGRVTGLLIEDDRWTVRYVVVSTAAWLGREVVVSPIAVESAAHAEKRLRVGLTREQIRNSPDLLAVVPITRNAEAAYAAYYGYPSYWGGPDLWAWAGRPGALALPPPERLWREAPDDSTEDAKERLHDSQALRGMYVEAIDGDIGHVEDLVIDDKTWVVRYLRVDTSNWPGGRSVLVATDGATASWASRRLRVTVARELVRAAPEYSPEALRDERVLQAVDAYYAGQRSQHVPE